MSPTLVVCPLSQLTATLNETRASSVVTLLRRDETAPSLPSYRHLWLGLSDIVAPRDGHVLAASDHLQRLFGFAAAWDRSRPLLIHCYAGVSRSTAAAFALACWLEPDRDEAELAHRLRRASPTATPNPRIVDLADQHLGRCGRMTSAIASIGRGAECFEGEPFSLAVGDQIPPYQS